MQDVLAQIVAELRALGLFCLIHGPEAWLALCINEHEQAHSDGV